MINLSLIDYKCVILIYIIVYFNDMIDIIKCNQMCVCVCVCVCVYSDIKALVSLWFYIIGRQTF